ncbi:MAG: PAS domain-containing protein [Candidatus Sumerlaeia bacterium]|nr:PAS domain-containing protein [Candidatus Sumerlaeia bacterium]
MQNELFILLIGILLGALVMWGVQYMRIRRLRSNNRNWMRLAKKLLGSPNFSTAGYDPYQKNQVYFETAEQLTADLRRFDERLKAVLNTMTEGLGLLEESGRVVLCNPAFTDMFHAKPGSQLEGKVFQQECARDFQAAVDAARQTQKVTTAELRLATTPNRDLFVTIRPYEDETIRQGFILTAMDITNRKQVEQMRTEFVANVSHELRTPLAAILGYVETMVEVGDGDDFPYARFIKIIHQHSLRLNALIEDLLVLSRIESRGTQLNLQSLPLANAVEQTITTLSTAADKKDVTILNALPPLLPDVRADQSSLERILINLVDNAIKYSEDRSEVQITARVQSGEVIVMVRDQGVGIPAEDQKRVFERFYRVDKARSRQAGGTGLGLSIVKHLVRSQGGEIWVDSTPGKGSTFSFSLPIANRTEDRRQPAVDSPAVGG